MKLTITIDLDNAAFEPPGPEVQRILRRIITDIKSEDCEPLNWPGPLFDSNGNTVGSLTIEPEAEKTVVQEPRTRRLLCYLHHCILPCPLCKD